LGRIDATLGLMTNPSNADLPVLSTVTSHLAAAFNTIEPEHLALPTPCEDWDLQALVDHVAGGNWFTLGILAGEQADDALAGAMSHFDEGNASAKQAAISAGDQFEAFQRPGVLQGTWHHLAGELTGSAILRIRLHDLVVHSWDIARTLNVSAALSEELAQWGLAELARNDSITVSLFGIGEPTRTATNGRPDLTYLETFGRRP
jgi:uncharacterized protein (TIGR03086 family)